MVKIGNSYYFLYILYAVVLFFILYFSLRKKSQKIQYRVLLIIMFCNLALHFGKLFFEPYRSDFPSSIKKVTFENICAISTLTFPWVILFRKNQTLNNYMFFIGLFGGIGALLYPTEAFGKDAFVFDVIRFYICHTNLFIIPLLLTLFGIVKLDYKKAIMIPIMFISIEIIIVINELILMKIGYVNATTLEFFDRDLRNSSFVFGPSSSFDGVAPILTAFTPKLFTKDIFGINNGIDFYWPVIWLIIPAFIYLPLAFIIMTFPFTHKELIHDIKNSKLYKKIFHIHNDEIESEDNKSTSN